MLRPDLHDVQKVFEKSRLLARGVFPVCPGVCVGLIVNENSPCVQGLLDRKMPAIYRSCAPLILASASPRRQQYFQDLGLEFRSHPADILEVLRVGERSEDFVGRMAWEKACQVMELYPESWIVAADTVVSLEGDVLGKPGDGAEAVAMLMRLSGKEHRVQTGVSLACRSRNVADTLLVSTRVVFWPFPQAVAEAYAATGEPLDKAGAYGIQGKGAFLVKEITGSYSNVVGLPLHEILAMLETREVIAVAVG